MDFRNGSWIEAMRRDNDLMFKIQKLFHIEAIRRDDGLCRIWMNYYNYKLWYSNAIGI